MSHLPLKICPKCHSASPLSTSVCAGCAHKFRTRFFLPAEQISVLAEPPTSLTGDTAAAQASLERNTRPSPPPQTFALPLSEIQYAAPGIRPPRGRRFMLAALLTVLCGAGVLLLVLGAFWTLHASGVKNTPGHLVSAQDAETLLPYCSPHQVRETLGAPLQVAHDTWSYPTDEGTIVSVTFSGAGGVQSVQKIDVIDGNGGILWQKNR